MLSEKGVCTQHHEYSVNMSRCFERTFPCIFHPLDSHTESMMLSAKEGRAVITGMTSISWSMSSIFLALGLSAAILRLNQNLPLQRWSAMRNRIRRSYVGSGQQDLLGYLEGGTVSLPIGNALRVASLR